MASLQVANDQGWNRWLVVGAGLVTFLIAGSLMVGAIRVAQGRREEVSA